MEKICVLRPEEPARLNPDRLDQLFVQLGERGAQNVICRAMEELALRLSSLEDAYRAGAHEAVRKGAKSLIGIADQIGMESLARVAGDVRRCGDRKDHVALASTLSRLVRIGDRSLTAVWDLQDLSV